MYSLRSVLQLSVLTDFKASTACSAVTRQSVQEGALAYQKGKGHHGNPAIQYLSLLQHKHQDQTSVLLLMMSNSGMQVFRYDAT